MKETLLALDISTTNVGIALFEIESKELLYIHYVNVGENINPKYKEELFCRLQTLSDHILSLVQVIETVHRNYRIVDIVVEEALKGSINPSTAQRLFGFNLLVRYWLYNVFDLEPKRISIHKVRKTMLKQYVDEKGVLKLPKNNNVKHLIWEEVNKKHNNINWVYNTKNNLYSYNYDMSDAYAVGYTYLTNLTK